MSKPGTLPQCSDRRMSSHSRGWLGSLPKTARKAILSDCKPGKKGFPGAQATLADGSTSSRCSELLQLVQSSDTATPTETIWGIDRMVAATSVALFACTHPTVSICVCCPAPFTRRRVKSNNAARPVHNWTTHHSTPTCEHWHRTAV